MTPAELREALNRLNLTVAEAARRMDVHYTTLSRQVNGKRKTVAGPIAAVVRCWLDQEGEKR